MSAPRHRTHIFCFLECKKSCSTSVCASFFTPSGSQWTIFFWRSKKRRSLSIGPSAAKRIIIHCTKEKRIIILFLSVTFFWRLDGNQHKFLAAKFAVDLRLDFHSGSERAWKSSVPCRGQHFVTLNSALCSRGHARPLFSVYRKKNCVSCVSAKFFVYRCVSAKKNFCASVCYRKKNNR